MKLRKRRSESVCLPPSHQTPGGSGGGLGESTGDSKDSPVFPHWAYALIAVLILVGAGLVFVLTRRRRRRDGSNRKYLQNKRWRSRQQYQDESGGGGSGNNPPMMSRVRERTMSSDETAFSADGGDDNQTSSSPGLGRWFRSNSSNSNKDIGIGRIDLEKREGGKKSTAAVVATANNITRASRAESITDNDSLYSSNFAFSVEEPPIAAPGVAIPAALKVPQDSVDDASVLGLYHVDPLDESRGSLAYDMVMMG
ncbi:hypothetical protein BGZ97_003505 [Linnemannia gamsii]|uniref:Uncharacterized protein n=1 Tax=Linnemannia gamsii TaxID=64522 RepID=A0A9P6UHN9_9FUNG|nr:hypothetical protein BGZ97_003505 [Linnemannia gamsii]